MHASDAHICWKVSDLTVCGSCFVCCLHSFILGEQVNEEEMMASRQEDNCGLLLVSLTAQQSFTETFVLLPAQCDPHPVSRYR